MALLLGSGGAPVLYDDFTGSNGTALDSYGKWTFTPGGTGVATIQTNKGDMTATGSSTSILESTQNVANGILITGTLGRVTGSGNIQLAIGVSGIVLFTSSSGILGGLHPMSFTCYIVKNKTNGLWYGGFSVLEDVLSASQNGSGETQTTSSVSGTPGVMSIRLIMGSGTSGEVTFDNVFVW